MKENRICKNELCLSEAYLLRLSGISDTQIDNIRTYNINILGVIVMRTSIKNQLKSLLKSLYFRYIKREIKDEVKLAYEVECNLKEIQNKIDVILGFDCIQYSIPKKILEDDRVNRIYVPNGASYLCVNNFKFPENKKIVLLDDYVNLALEKRGLTENYYKKNIEQFNQTYEWLEDVKSKDTMKKYLNGHISKLQFPLIDVWNRENVRCQYFEKEIINLSNDEIFVDCGAYTGDTLDVFNSLVDSFEKYYAWEPDARRFRRLNSVIKNSKGDVLHIKKGVWDKETYLHFSTDAGCGEVCESESNNKKVHDIPVDTIDNIIFDDARVSFIKMDIEGSELAALHGAENVIKRDRPKLAICVYHKKEDLISIPQYIKQLNPEYKLYLRAYYPWCAEVVLYAI